MKRYLQPLLVLCLAAFMQGCAIWGAVDDERLSDTMASDKAVTTILKKNLYSESMSVGWNMDVFTYYGHVFLVGECPQDQRARAIDLAKKDNRVRSVTAHWFTEKESSDSDFMTATRLRSNLIGTKGLSSTRVDTVVNAGRVVLLGVVANEKEKQLAVHAAQTTTNVKSVTSYLFSPPKAGQPDPDFSGENYPSLAKQSSDDKGGSSSPQKRREGEIY